MSAVTKKRRARKRRATKSTAQTQRADESAGAEIGQPEQKTDTCAGGTDANRQPTGAYDTVSKQQKDIHAHNRLREWLGLHNTPGRTPCRALPEDTMWVTKEITVAFGTKEAAQLSEGFLENAYPGIRSSIRALRSRKTGSEICFMLRAVNEDYNNHGKRAFARDTLRPSVKDEELRALLENED
jgi:hypothetical protein